MAEDVRHFRGTRVFFENEAKGQILWKLSWLSKKVSVPQRELQKNVNYFTDPDLHQDDKVE